MIMTVAKKMQDFSEKSSWIRKMFEEGAMMKAKYGAENVLISALAILMFLHHPNSLKYSRS